MTDIIRKNQWFYILYVAFLAISCYFLLSLSKEAGFLWINGHFSDWSDQFFRYFTYLGDGITYAVLIAICFFLNKWNAWIGLLSYAASSLVVQLLKNFIFPGMPRPRTVIPDLSMIHFVDGEVVHAFNSFPSGHAATAFSIAVWLTYLKPNHFLSLLYLLLAAGVAYSRVYLAQHFPLDVVAGSIIGVIVTLVVIWRLQEYRKKKG